MRITILASGSRGDVQPYAALGRGLGDIGHRVRLVTQENFESLARDQGLDFYPIKGDSQELLNSAAGMELTGAGSNPFKMMRAIQQTFGTFIAAYIEAFSAPELFDSEVILDQLPAALFGYDLAEKLNVPHIVASVIPLVPTRAWPLPLITTRAMGGVPSRLTYALAGQLAWAGFRPAINRFRRQLGLRPAPRTGKFAVMRWLRDPIINGFSPLVVPPPRDWGANVHTTGWWILDEPTWTPPADLLAFLDAGAPPVYVGFGSMPMADPAATTATVIEALRLSGQRGILSRGWAGMGSVALPASIHLIDYVPYDFLFPRTSMVIHHGGSGTTGLALRSGVPSMVVAFAADQPYWGERTAALGVGPQPLRFKALTVGALAAAIQKTVADAPMRARAVDLAAKLRRENGLASAVQIVSEHLAKTH